MIDFYKNTWHGGFDGTDEELSTLLLRAGDIVDNAIALSGYTISTAPDIFSERVKKAVCAQADFIESNGGVDSLTEGSYASATLGRFSYSESLQSGSESATVSNLCALSLEYLAPTGLLYKGAAIL